MKALDIANKLLYLAYNSEIDELMSNMKLQKMLYYEQGFHLAYFNSPLFDEEIEAWRYGPVVPSIYQHFKSNGGSGIMPPENCTIVEFSDKEEDVFNEVYKVYSNYSASGLVTMTHSEAPWLSAHKKNEGDIIQKKTMSDFFKTLI